MKTLLIALLFVASPVLAQIHTARPCDLPTYDHTLFQLPLLAPCPSKTGVFKVSDSSVDFEHGATIDFADYTGLPNAVGATPTLYVWIKVQGTYFLIPAYTPNYGAQ
jgi:hypothetical protein